MSTIITSLLGLGIFLYGMHLLVEGLNALGSDSIRQILSRSTKYSLSSVLTGTGITAIVQSSSMVSLIVLAFASAGMIPLFNAVGVILGANLGTTFTGWVVATIGFKMDLEAFALPCFGIAALFFVFVKPNTPKQATLKVFMGLGLLIFGLDQMKDAVSSLPEILEPDLLSNLHPITFALIGIAMTAIIQSSSAMTMIALTALHGGYIDLYGAAALVVGADLGTTSTTMLGSLRGSPIMKQLALSHVIYNVTVDLFAFFIMLPFLPMLLDLFGVTDPLYGLVLFHSSFNLVGLVIFVPLLKPYSAWLGSFFVQKHPVITPYLAATPPSVTPAAKKALEKETRSLIVRCMLLNLRNLKIDLTESPNIYSIHNEIDKQAHNSFEESYLEIKEVEGEIRHYCSAMMGKNTSPEDKEHVNALLDAARDAVYSCKTLKDNRHSLVEFRHPKLGINFDTSTHYKAPINQIYSILFDLLTEAHRPHGTETMINQANSKNESLHQDLHNEIVAHMNQLSEAYGGDKLEHDERDDAATLLNTNREIWLSNLNIIDAINTFSRHVAEP